jgi:hypothetical protein
MRGYGYVFAAAYKRRKKTGALVSSLIYVQGQEQNLRGFSF